jgi:hypothetical protein
MTTKTFARIHAGVLPIYPFLLGLFPVLYLWSANRAQVPAYVVIPPLLDTLVGLLVLFLAAYAIFRDVHRAALLTAVLSFAILAYGHFSNLVLRLTDALEAPDLLLITGLLLIAILIVIVARRLGSPALSKALNLVTGAMVLMQVVVAAPYYLQMARLNNLAAGGSGLVENFTAATGDQPEPRRDVYFILLDNYGRQDDLLKRFGFDNSELVNALEERGFVFPDCAQGNYFWTAPAISSILNMDYLDELDIPEESYIKRGKYGRMAPLIQNSEVLQRFKSYDYHVVTFRGFMGLIDIQNSDTYINYEEEVAIDERLETRKFESLYWDTTLFPAFNDEVKVYPDLIEKYGPLILEEIEDETESEDVLEPEFRQVYEQNLYAFDALENIPREIESPKFVYAHIYSAHWPFMLRPDGSLRLPFTQKMTTPGYVDAVRYTNSRILDAIDSILENSEIEPVIILQGDHSNGWVADDEWSGADRVKILSAYYLPGGGEQMLYDTISPVNNFRLVFKQYFGEDIELLPDINYYLQPKTRQITRALPTCISDLPEIPRSRK